MNSEAIKVVRPKFNEEIHGCDFLLTGWAVSIFYGLTRVFAKHDLSALIASHYMLRMTT